MPRRSVTFDAVRKAALTLPDVDEGRYYGVPAFFVRGRMFVCQASHRSAEPGTLVALVGFDQRDELLRSEPDIYYVTDHYIGYPSVLVRWARLHPDALRGLLRTAHNFVATREQEKARARKRARHG